MQSVWRVQPANPRLADRLAQELGIHPLTAQLLITRGVRDRAQGARFLQPSLASLDDPYRLPDVERAVSRLKRAIATHEPILIFSDSDVDGLTASVILYEVLRSFSVCLLVGFISGVYSTVYIASALVVTWRRMFQPKPT